MSPPRILNPRAVPVAGTDAHLPALPAPRLSAAALRQRFAVTPAWEPEFRGDGNAWLAANTTRTATAASVLVPLVQRPEGLRVLLTMRTAHLRDHAGQISFPGGRQEAHDADVRATALRETEEEVGLARQHIEVLGTLAPYTTVTQFIVTPVVALVQPPFELKLDSFEVAEAFEVPLAFLMTPAHHHRHVVDLEGQQRQFLSMPWTGTGSAGVEREFFIWGATAAMLRNLYRFLAA